MNYNVIFAPKASDDLENLLVYLIDEAGPETARNYVGKIVDYCSFETFPERGAVRDDLRPGLRVVGYRGKASIAFENIVSILRVFHRGQDVRFDDN
ncbi:type II toxin-antitoxin system RelE/ParE family toxin [Rhizobium leguminosarum]|uniref:type II toxin-antitoxin system RelE/ParE family toxin n=1 Tax=Rhizobium leguminosarum TaxID=384 RepID=UPI0013BABFB8|nr:type II toxin-antitoxin system RelE/ParE family toxin [Rhizobium leguminosarum]MBY5323057.1 type II toxin-antitoxin system RelE/ParE family toxin [Rhizobium leguminosarum]MBY5382473.1 type II toxin-antitoxin system RelE/ParE family toxin [Rhizobium leguminosarum]NEH71539.1 type II toxin-antitoxin system RelE/ParE family toxin [Rhizobium leguminosarum]